MSKINKDIIGHFAVLPRQMHDDFNLHKNPVLFQIMFMMCCYADNKTQQLFVIKQDYLDFMVNINPQFLGKLKKLVKLGPYFKNRISFEFLEQRLQDYFF